MESYVVSIVKILKKKMILLCNGMVLFYYFIMIAYWDILRNEWRMKYEQSLRDA